MVASLDYKSSSWQTAQILYIFQSGLEITENHRLKNHILGIYIHFLIKGVFFLKYVCIRFHIYNVQGVKNVAFSNMQYISVSIHTICTIVQLQYSSVDLPIQGWQLRSNKSIRIRKHNKENLCNIKLHFFLKQTKHKTKNYLIKKRFLGKCFLLNVPSNIDLILCVCVYVCCAALSPSFYFCLHSSSFVCSTSSVS